MSGASLEWLAPDICVVRAGDDHERFGDPEWSYCVTVKVIDGKAEFHAGRGFDNDTPEKFWANYRSQRAVIRALRAAGIAVDSDWTRIRA